jgi:outer membrane receptor for ferrienterochelin and colicin
MITVLTLGLGLTALGYGKAYLMGNENQKHNGDGETSGYMIFNADAHWSPAKNWLVSLKAINLLDKDYYSGGRLLMNGFTGVGTNTRDQELMHLEALALFQDHLRLLGLRFHISLNKKRALALFFRLE